MELSASSEKRTIGAWLSSLRASAAELEKSTLQAKTLPQLAPTVLSWNKRVHGSV
jgi:hypothetical protein